MVQALELVAGDGAPLGFAPRTEYLGRHGGAVSGEDKCGSARVQGLLRHRPTYERTRALWRRATPRRAWKSSGRRAFEKPEQTGRRDHRVSGPRGLLRESRSEEQKRWPAPHRRAAE